MTCWILLPAWSSSRQKQACLRQHLCIPLCLPNLRPFSQSEIISFITFIGLYFNSHFHIYYQSPCSVALNHLTMHNASLGTAGGHKKSGWWESIYPSRLLHYRISNVQIHKYGKVNAMAIYKFENKKPGAVREVIQRRVNLYLIEKNAFIPILQLASPDKRRSWRHISLWVRV